MLALMRKEGIAPLCYDSRRLCRLSNVAVIVAVALMMFGAIAAAGSFPNGPAQLGRAFGTFGGFTLLGLGGVLLITTAIVIINRNKADRAI